MIKVIFLVNQIDKYLDIQSVFLLLISSTFPKAKLVLIVFSLEKISVHKTWPKLDHIYSHKTYLQIWSFQMHIPSKNKVIKFAIFTHTHLVLT